MTRSLWTVVAGALLVGCGEQAPTTLGVSFEGPSVSVVAAQRANVESSVILRGTMTKKCPVAGCWFILQDQSGTIKVDTKNAGFVVVDIPLNTALAVVGRVTTNGAERIIEAVGVRF